MPPVSRPGRALLIGLDAHSDAPALRGSVNDVRLMADVIAKAAGITEIVLLTNRNATRAQILGRLDDAVGATGRHETLFVHYSGWGVRISAQEGIRPVRTAWRPHASSGERLPPHESYDSALVPYDGTTSDRGSMITYGELRERLRHAEGTVILAFDVPFSGTLLGDLDTARLAYVGAAGVDEVGYEFMTPDGVYQGTLSYFLAQALLRSPGATIGELFRDVAREIASRFPGQHPVLEGNADLRLGRSEQPAAVGVRVSARDGDQITLDAGAASGLSVRSQWSLHALPRGGAAETKVGVVEISRVTATDAKARVLSEAWSGAIAPGARAEEELHNYGDMRLRVRLNGSDDSAVFRELLAGAESLELLLADATVEPDVTVRVVKGGESVMVDGESEPRTFDAPTWVVEDSRERVVLEPRPTLSRAAYELRRDLAKLARHTNVVGLKNPNRRSALAGKVELHLMRRGAAGWEDAPADPKRGLVVFQEGELICLRIENRHDTPVHLTVLDLGLTMRISPLTVPSPVAANGRVDFASALFVPADFWRAAGFETIKVFATSYPLDVKALLFQEGARDIGSWGADGSSTELWQLLDMALSGRGDRESRPVQLPADQEWTTVEQVFELRRERR